MGIYNDMMFPTSPLNREKPHTAGMSAAERAAYNKKTGGNLKAPQPEGGSRKESYCARSAGIKKCKDPDKSGDQNSIKNSYGLIKKTIDNIKAEGGLNANQTTQLNSIMGGLDEVVRISKGVYINNLIRFFWIR